MTEKPPVSFVPTKNEYDNAEKTNLFSILLYIHSSTIAEKKKSGVVEGVESKKKVKDSQF